MNQSIQADYRRFEFDGSNCRLSAIDYGGEGPDMVVVHGMRDHALSMTSIVNALKDRWRIVVPDLRGHGDSNNPGSYAMTQFVADLRALVDHLSLETPVLIGHSLGGHITSKFAAIYPDEVAALALIDGMGPPRPPREVSDTERIESWRAAIAGALALSSERRRMADSGEALMRLQRNNPGLAADTARLIAEAGVEPHPGGGVRWKWDPAVNMVWNTFDHRESEQLWRLIECPVLIVTGEDSMKYWSGPRFDMADDAGLHERETERRRQLFKDARHQTIPGAGHMIHYDQPEALNRCLANFLDEVTG